MGLMNPRQIKTYTALFWLWLSLTASFAGAKYQVCSMTINSPDEINIFKTYLPRRDFDFVELVPLSVESRPNNTHWFKSVCEQGHRCDVLVISGHFGGLFFGKNHNYILPVDMMQRHACMKSCEGVLSQVREVFLFGCNTLADKSRDHRTPEEYARILTDEYHMITDMAQMVAAAKYFPFGLSFEEQMQMVFSNPRTSLYGFSSLSPLGEKIRPPLSRYFQAVSHRYGSYKSYLDQKNPRLFNPLFTWALGGSAKEIKSLPSSHPLYKKFQQICPLHTNSLPPYEGMQIVKNLLETGDGPLAYTAIKSFMNNHQPFTGPEGGIFNSLKQRSDLQSEFINLYRQISPYLPYIKIQFLNFLNLFNWVEENFYLEELYSRTLKQVRQSTSASYDFISALAYNERVPVQRLGLTSDDFGPGFYKNIWSPLILEVFNIQDYRAHRRLMNLCVRAAASDPVLCYQVMKTLGHLNVSDALVIDRMEYFLRHKPWQYGLIWYAMYGLAYARVSRPQTEQAIAYHLYNENSHTSQGRWVQLQGIKTLHFLKTQDSYAARQLVKVLQTSRDPEVLLAALKVLYQMQSPPLKSLRQVIYNRKLNQHSNAEVRKWALFFIS